MSPTPDIRRNEKYMKNFTFVISICLLAVMLLSSAAGCAAPTTTGTATPATGTATPAARMVKRVVPAHKGDLVVNVSVDGNLNMPQAFDLHFGAPGDVKEVLCKEGDRVKAGAILARLDDTTQRLDIKSSNNGIQNTLSNLYETLPRLPQFRTKFYDTSTPLPTTVTTVSPITTTTMWNVDVPPPPPVGPPVVTVVTTTTGRSEEVV